MRPDTARTSRSPVRHLLLVPDDDQLRRIADALDMSVEEMTTSGRASSILLGREDLKVSQGWTLIKAFLKIENPKTRSKLIALVESISVCEARAER